MRALLVALLALPLAAGADEYQAVRTLPAGTVLSQSDLTLVPTARPGPPAADLVGKQLRVAAYAGRAITPGQLDTPTLVARNQIVTLAYDRASLRIQTEARALGAGGAGDVIRVMNLSSRVTLDGRINSDGTVSVVQR